MSQITTHVLDTSRGKPAAGIRVELYVLQNRVVKEIGSGTTDENGRVTELLSSDRVLPPGIYKLVFDTGQYFQSSGDTIFYPIVEIHFTIADAAHYHIPLLISPFGYTTYRGS